MKFFGPIASNGLRQRQGITFGSLLVVALAVSVAGMTLTFSSHAAPANTVYRSGTQLMLNGAPYKFVGFNTYGVQGCEGQAWTRADLDKYFAALPPASMTRMWAYQAYGLTAIDQAVASAEAHNQKLVLVLENDSSDCVSDGAKNNNWYQSGYSSYLAWAKTVAARYANSPAIGMWEVINEAGQAQGEGQLDGTTMKNFYQAVAGAIKSVDPNHLVETGENGEFNYAAGASGYQTAASAADIDVLSLHDYESDYSSNTSPMSSHFGPTKAAANAVGKPIIIGEVNDSACNTDKTTRANNVRTAVDQYLANGAAGVMVWNFSTHYYTQCPGEDYILTYGDPLAAIIQNYKIPGIQAVTATTSAPQSGSVTPTPAPLSSTTLPAPTISTLTASPSVVPFNQSTVLSWTASNAATCSVSPGGPQASQATSWQTASLTSAGTHSYTLTCYNPAGVATSRSVSVVVQAPQAPPATPTVAASKTIVTAGAQVTLYWSAPGASACQIRPGSGIISGSSGSQDVTVQTTSTYQVACSNSAGTSPTATITINVGTGTTPPSIVAFFAAPTSISSGATTTLYWSASNATACGIANTPLSSTIASSSYITPRLSNSQSYTLSCWNQAGAVITATAGVSVDGKPIPAAPAALLPASADSSANYTSGGQTITNGSTTSSVSGLVTLDPSNTKTSTNVQKVEYYEGELLLQTLTIPPYALDTTRLTNGNHTITERIYYVGGARSEITRVLAVSNAAKVAKRSTSQQQLLGIIMATALPLMLVGGGGYWLWRRYSQNHRHSALYASAVDQLNRY